MLDKRTELLLDFIVSSCESGEYTIISFLDMINIFPKKYKMEKFNISQMLSYLSERSYIDIKHNDENCCCVCPLPKARIEHENKQNSQNNIKKLRKIAIFCIFFAFFFAFLGAMLGVIVSKLFF